MPNPLSPETLAGGLPTEDELKAFVASVRPEYTTRALPHGEMNLIVREILADPNLSAEAKSKVGESVFNAIKYRAPYAMGDLPVPHTFGQPSSHNRVKPK